MKTQYYYLILVSITLLFFSCVDSDSDSKPDIPTEPSVEEPVNQDARYKTLWQNYFNLNQDFHNKMKDVHGTGCNSVRFGHHKDMGNTIIARLNNNPDPMNSCSSGSWKLSLFRMNWDNFEMTYMRDLLTPGTTISGGSHSYKISTAYDATVIKYQKELWIAFECHGTGFQGTAATCVGPLDSNYNLITSRTYPIVMGTSYDSKDQYIYSASVPKLVVHKTIPYLYWTVVKMGKNAPHAWSDLTTRGMEITKRNGLLVPSFSNSHIPSNHPKTFEVWGLDQDTRSNKVADVFDIKSDGKHLYAIAGIGGGNCLTPVSGGSGCYRMKLARTETPLGHRVFNQNMQREGQLPSYPQEYASFFSDPYGRLILMTQFVIQNRGVKAFIITGNDNPHDENCNPSNQPGPQWGMKEGSCYASCGDIGGEIASDYSCKDQDMIEAGIAYDTPFCCKTGTPGDDPVDDDPVDDNPDYANCSADQTYPHWGMRDGKCYQSCGNIGGTAAYPDSCSNHQMTDAGIAYDTPYCCR